MSAVQPGPVMSAAGPAVSRSRRELRGLAALAIVVVLCGQLVNRPAVGTLGVSVAFTLIGFLATRRLMAQWQYAGSVPLWRFSRDWLKWVVPTAWLVVTVTLLVATTTTNAPRPANVSVAPCALLMVANWCLGSNGGGLTDQPSALQNFWAVSVTGQFLIVWPLLLAVLARLTGSRRSGMRAFMMLNAVVFVGSFGYQLVSQQSAPAETSISTAGNLWQFAAGALLAGCTGALRRLPARAGPVLAWVGMIGLLTAVVIAFSRAELDPRPALLAVVCVAAVIGAGDGGHPRYSWPLTNRGAGYLGDLAYCLYLWYLPVVVLLGQLAAGVRGTVEALVVLAALAVATHHGVEEPLRRSPLLERFHHGAMRAHAWENWSRGAPAITGPALLALMATITAVEVQVTSSSPINATPTQKLRATPQVSAAGQAPDPLDALQKKIAGSVRAATFEGVSPSPASLSLASLQHPWQPSGCADVTSAASVTSCTTGSKDAQGSVVVVGDSLATAWLPGIRQAFPDRRIIQLTKDGCPAWSASVAVEGRPDATCDRQHAWVAGYLRDHRQTVVVLATGSGLADDLASRSTGAQAVSEIQDGLQRTIVVARATGAKVVVLGSPPGAQPWIDCYRPASSPMKCWGPTTAGNTVTAQASRAAARTTGAKYVDVDDWFCAEDHCPAFVGTTPVYADGVHLTPQYARSLSGLLRSALT